VSDFVWWTGLFFEAISGNAEAVTALVAASPERDRRLEENGHFARSPMQLADPHHSRAARGAAERADGRIELTAPWRCLSCV
jgi:hypothetical protein